MRLKTVYLLLCVVGLALPYSQLVPWAADNGLHLRLFFGQLFANRVGAFFGMDVLVSALTLMVFAFAEGRRLKLGARALADARGGARRGSLARPAAVSLPA